MLLFFATYFFNILFSFTLKLQFLTPYTLYFISKDIMAQKKIQEHKIQLFSDGKQQVSVIQFEKYLQKKGVQYKLQQGIISTIGKRNFDIWNNIYKQDNPNKLIKIQLFENLADECKGKQDIKQFVTKANQKLTKIGQKQVNYEDFKKAVKESDGKNIHQKYKQIVKSKQIQQTKPNQTKVQQSTKVESKSHDQQSAVKKQAQHKPQQKHSNVQTQENKQKLQEAKIERQENAKQKQVKNDKQAQQKQHKDPVIKQKKQESHQDSHQKPQAKQQNKIKPSEDGKQNEEAKPKQQLAHASEQNKQESKAQQQKHSKIQEGKPHHEQQKHTQQINLDKIVHKFIQTEQITNDQIKLITKQSLHQCTKQTLLKFKHQIAAKVLDGEQLTFAKYKQWREKQQNGKKQHNQSKPQTHKQQKVIQNVHNQKAAHQIPNQQSHHESKQIIELLQKYFKQNKAIHREQKEQGKLRINLKHETQQEMQNELNYKLKIDVSSKEIGQYEQLESKKLFQDFKGHEYVVAKIYTKKAEELEQYVQAKIKDKTLSLAASEFKTFTDDDKLNLVFKVKSTFLANLQRIIKHQKQQNSCKIVFDAKVGVGNPGKEKPQNRKLIKCIVRGFELTLGLQGSLEVVERFRKNLQTENPQSKLHILLSLTKNSQLKLKWKKIQDVNNFMNKLGILEAVKITPSIKSILTQSIFELFEKDVALNMQVSKVLAVLMEGHESSQIQMVRVGQSALVELGIANKQASQLLLIK